MTTSDLSFDSFWTTSRLSMGWALLLALMLTGCSSTNISQLAAELAKDPAANCIIVNAGPYGGVTLARGTPDVSVSVSANGCSIEGSGVTRLTVPTGSVLVAPTLVKP